MYGRKEMKTLPFLICLGLVMLLAACSSTSNHPEKTIENVLQEQFSGPDQKLMDLLNDPANATVIGENEGEYAVGDTITDVDVYLEEKYGAYFTEEMYDKFIGAFALGFQTTAYQHGYQLEVTEIDTQQKDSDDAYTFEVMVQYKNEERENNTEVTGEANINDQGKITRILYHDDGGLLEAMRSGH